MQVDDFLETLCIVREDFPCFMIERILLHNLKAEREVLGSRLCEVAQGGQVSAEVLINGVSLIVGFHSLQLVKERDVLLRILQEASVRIKILCVCVCVCVCVVMVVVCVTFCDF